MGVGFLTCHNCGHNFPDCGEFVRCESCGTNWCNDACAEEEGFIAEHCALYNVYGYHEMSEIRKDKECPFLNGCYECGYYVSDSCNLCRGEDYEDAELLQKALELLQMKREDLIEKMKV